MNTSQESVNLFQRLVAEKQSEVLGAIDSLMSAYATGNKGGIKNGNAALKKKLEQLQESISAQDRPSWLREMLNSCTRFEVKGDTPAEAKAHFTLLTSRHSQAKEHDWQFSTNKTTPIVDFDSIVEECIRDSRIDELVNKLIETLKKIIDSDLVDSRAATSALQTLLTTLQSSKQRSFYSQVVSFRFVAKYGKNLGKAYLKKIQELAPFVEAWDETLDELDIEYKTVQDNLRERVDVIEGEWTEELSQKIEKQPQTQLAQLPDEYEGKD